MMRTPIFQNSSFLGLFFKPWQSYIILLAFLVNSFGPLPAYAQDYHLPAPGVMVRLSPPLDPPILKGIKVYPDNPFRFDFILDKGDSQLSNDALKDESSKLIKYFLASLTIPEKDLWVNLSPYEKDRIIPNSFGFTEMGRDLLAEDYMLKQITASLIYPEEGTGKKFWKRIYEEAQKKFGTTNIPVNTFNKVWIVPDKAVVYENAKAGTAYVVEAKLKVMLEQDYLAFEKNQRQPGDMFNKEQQKNVSPSTLPSELGLNSKASQVNNGSTSESVNALGSQIVREIVIPELTKEVNENKNFAKLRQVYNSLILATWYKKKIKDSILFQVYADKNKVAGVNIDDPQEKQKIYQRYLQAFKKGVYNYIKEEQDPMTQEIIPRKYFSGGMRFNFSNAAMTTTSNSSILRRMWHFTSMMVLGISLVVTPSAMQLQASQNGQQEQEYQTNENISNFDINYFSSLSNTEKISMLDRLSRDGTVASLRDIFAIYKREGSMAMRDHILNLLPSFDIQLLYQVRKEPDPLLRQEIARRISLADFNNDNDQFKQGIFDWLIQEDDPQTRSVLIDSIYTLYKEDGIKTLEERISAVTLQDKRRQLYERLDEFQRDRLIDVIHDLNDLHDVTDRQVRFASVKGYSAKELYDVMVYGNEAPIYPSTFFGLFDLFLKRIKVENLSGGRLMDRNFRIFIQQAVSFNRLNQFLGTMNVEQGNALLEKFVSNIDQEPDPGGQGAVIADALGGMIIDPSTDPSRLKVLQEKIKWEYERVKEGNEKIRILYGLLSGIFGSKAVVDQEWFAEMAQQYKLPEVDKLPDKDIFDQTGANIQRYFFYNDNDKNEDGWDSYMHLIGTYQGKNGWSVKKGNLYTVISAQRNGRRIVIYANNPRQEKKGNAEIDKVLEGKVVLFYYQRGHVFHDDDMIREIRPGAVLVGLGSCGGFYYISSVLSKSPNAQLFYTKGTGTMLINDAIGWAFNEAILQGNGIVWRDFEAGLQARFAKNSDIQSYQFPNKTKGVSFLKGYQSLTGTTEMADQRPNNVLFNRQGFIIRRQIVILNAFGERVRFIDHAQAAPIVTQRPGGINFNSDKMNLQLQNAGQEIKFHVDPAMLQQLQNAPGFTIGSIIIQPLKSLPEFLGLNQSQTDAYLAAST